MTGQVSRSVTATRVLALLAALGVSTGCTVVATNPDPRPNVFLNRDSRTLRLAGLEGIPQQMTIGFGLPLGISGIIGEVRVLGWREAIRKGFNAAFGRAFRVVESSPAELVLELVEVIPTIVVENREDPTDSTVEVRFKARLTERGGASRPIAGTVSSRRSLLYGATAVVSSALEVMYETLASELFVDPAPRFGSSTGR